MKKFAVLIVSGLLAGCASSSDDIAAAYVSPLQYNSYNCSQLSSELQRVSARLLNLTRTQDKQAQEDAVATGVGLVLFWPALFFIDGDEQTAGELGRLKGEFEAIEKTAIQRDCSIQTEIREARAAQEQYRIERANSYKDQN